ncbi:hypothetical protein CBS101457_003284 [Exobasidium rhododendri]|nr:hypothetical protein CBS101457_003284 [Exobasidium rhododendri]
MSKEETPVFQSSIYPPSSLKPSSLLALSVLLQSFIDEQCREHLQGYIWQREAPKVIVDNTLKRDDLPRLLVSMRHGGSVEDEWLAVHLLLLASANPRFTEGALLKVLEDRQEEIANDTGLIIDVRDEDGQFLLIEAADFLPQWVQPDNADGRLWMYQGQFHLIQPEIHKGNLAKPSNDDAFDHSDVKSLDPSTAVRLIYSSHNTVAPQSFTDAIMKQRLPSYPELSWANYNQHTTLVYLPSKAAHALLTYPQLISSAAEAFDGREGPIDARCLRDMKVFGPSSSAASSGDVKEKQATILVKVKLPRRLYATLLSQRYLPPVAFGEDWRRAVSTYWQALELASRGEASVGGKDEKERSDGRRRDLGCKITCGLELAYANVKERLRSKQTDLFGTDSEDSQRSLPFYESFIASLNNIGFFGENISHSKEWSVKEKEALALWRQSHSTPSKMNDEHISNDLQYLVNVMAEEQKSISTSLHFDATLPDHVLSLEEDPDGFLYDVPEQSNAKGEASGQEGDSLDEGETEEERAAMSQVNAFASKLQGFVDGKGDESGALFEDEAMESDEESEEGHDATTKKRVEDLCQAERDEAMKDIVPQLPAEEWGAKSRLPSKGLSAKMAQVENESALGKKEKVTASGSSGVATGFSRRVRYDGASDSEESVDDEILRAGDTEEDRTNRAKWLGMEKELEEDEAKRRKEKEDGDQVAADGEYMDAEEDGEVKLGDSDLLNFIEFTRKELGLSTEQYENILQQRRERGAYVPVLKSKGEAKNDGSTFLGQQARKVDFEVPPSEQQPGIMEDVQHKSGRKVQAEKREEKEKSLRNQRTTKEEKKEARERAQRVVEEVEAGAGNRTMKQEDVTDDPFEKLMRAMDEELLKHKGLGATGQGQEAQVGNSTPSEEEESESDENMTDEMSAEDAELLEKMLHSEPPSSLRALLEKRNKQGDSNTLSAVEEEVMHSMLASYQAQMGGAGPVGTLAGRLGVGLLPSE